MIVTGADLRRLGLDATEFEADYPRGLQISGKVRYQEVLKKHSLVLCTLICVGAIPNIGVDVIGEFEHLTLAGLPLGHWSFNIVGTLHLIGCNTLVKSGITNIQAGRVILENCLLSNTRVIGTGETQFRHKGVQAERFYDSPTWVSNLTV